MLGRFLDRITGSTRIFSNGWKIRFPSIGGVPQAEVGFPMFGTFSLTFSNVWKLLPRINADFPRFGNQRILRFIG